MQSPLHIRLHPLKAERHVVCIVEEKNIKNNIKKIKKNLIDICTWTTDVCFHLNLRFATTWKSAYLESANIKKNEKLIFSNNFLFIFSIYKYNYLLVVIIFFKKMVYLFMSCINT